MPCLYWKHVFIKLVAFWVAFLLLHFAYRWLPLPWIAVIGANSEGALQHMKIAFFAYSLVSLGEYFVRRVPSRARQRFIDSRLLAANLAPWGMFLWYLLPALYGQPMPNKVLEIVYANIILVLVGLGLILLEGDFSRVELSRQGRTVIVAVYLASAVIMVALTFRSPWAGFFTAQY